jgi:hypothetical protein
MSGRAGGVFENRKDTGTKIKQKPAFLSAGFRFTKRVQKSTPVIYSHGH